MQPFKVRWNAVRRLHGSGLFLNTCREVAEQYPEVDDYHIDAMTVHLVRRQLGACTVN